VDLSVRGRTYIRAERQPTRRHRLRQQIVEAGLVERRLAVLQRLDPGQVDVDPHDVVTELCHRRRVHRTEVAATDHRDLHWFSSTNPAAASFVR
jgi:hypothetical protein